MFVIELVLNGFLTAKRCPPFWTAKGQVDHSAIREYFAKLGYEVGEIRGVATLPETA
jgi:hypothetical protein